MNAANKLRILSLLCVLLMGAGGELGLTTLSALAAMLLFGFVPGLAIQRRAVSTLRLKHLLAAAVVSLPISTLCFAVTRYFDWPAAISVWIIALPILLYSMVASGGREGHWRLRSGDRTALLCAVVAAGLLYLAMRAPGILASWHGYFHAAVTEQILNERVPPSNPGLVGETLNFYWAFHVFVALITAAGDANPLTVIALINATMLALTLILAYEVARCFLLRARYRLLCMAAVLGAINMGAGLVLAGKFAKNRRIPGDAFSDGTWIDWLSQRAIPGRLWDGRASSLIKEYYDISGMAAGLTLLFAYVWLWTCGPRRFGAGFLPLLIATMLTLTTWYPPLALPAFVHGGIAVFVWCWRERLRWPGGDRALAISAITALLSAALVALYFRAITDSAGWASTGEPFISLRFDVRSIVGAVMPFWAIAPILLIGCVMARVGRRRPANMHLLLLALILLAFATLTDLQQNTQYKYVYALSLPLGILTVMGVAQIIRFWAPARQNPRLACGIWSIFFVHPAIVFAIGAATSAQQSDRSTTIQGRHIVDHSDPARMSCLAWIRDHSPRDAVLILPLIEHDRSPSNPGFRDVAIAQRAAVLVYDTYHSLRFHNHESRAAILTAICEQGDFNAATTALREIPLTRSIYAVIPLSKLAKGTSGWSTEFTNETWMVVRCDDCDRGRD